MSIWLTNSLSKKKEEFVPLNPGEVKMYVCGPTVYNFIHIGNARVNVFYDVVERFFTYSGFKVTRVMNFTDVDDKIIVRATQEKTDSLSISEKYIKEFLIDMEQLGVNPPKFAPKVTEHLAEIISLIEGLVANGSAYVATNGEVFFSVRNFKEYGKLSGKNIDDLISGARVQTDEKKRDPLDFSLWKPRKNESEPSWDSPWGKGRPGWHIECSAMSIKYLGESFDLHGGGMDLIHPHHENEIAQSEAFTKKPFARYWIHSNMLTFNAEKMSKSLGNIMLTREFINKYSAEVLRYFLISNHYRSTIDYSKQHIKEVQSTLHRFYSTLKKAHEWADSKAVLSVDPAGGEQKIIEFGEGFESKWKEAMEDDLNTAKVLGFVFEYVRMLNSYLDRKGFKPTAHTVPICRNFKEQFLKLSTVLNILGMDPNQFLADLKSKVLVEKNLSEEMILKLINERILARQNKDFATSDRIRNELLAIGIELRDKGTITEWDFSFQTSSQPN